MSEKLTFKIDKIKLIEDASNSQLAKVRMHIVSEGDNKHNKPISKDAIQLSKHSLIGKPILCKYNKYSDSFEGHEPDEIPVGVFLKEDEIYEEEIDDKLWLVADAYIWKLYFPEIMRVLEKNDGESAISMEIMLLETEIKEDELEHINLFSFLGVTLIGTSPAIENAKANVLQFSEMVEKTEQILQGLDVENFSTEDIDNQEKEVEQMTFNKDEFAVQFSMTAADAEEMMREACGKMKYQVEDREYSKYWMITYDENYMYAYNEENGGKTAIPYSIEDGKVKCDFENAKSCKTMTQWVILEEENEEDDIVAMAIEKAKEEKEKFADNANNETTAQVKLNEKESEDNEKLTDEEKMAAEEVEKEKEEFASKITDLEEKFNALFEENKIMKNENEELKTFKATIEENDKKAKIEFTLQEVMEAGMPKEKAEEFREKAIEFTAENINIWVNEVKANALEFATKEKTKDEGFIKVGLTWAVNDSEKKKGLWN